MCVLTAYCGKEDKAGGGGRSEDRLHFQANDFKDEFVFKR